MGKRGFTWLDGLILALILGAVIAWTEFRVHEQGYNQGYKKGYEAGAQFQLEYDLDKLEGLQD